MAGIPGMNQGGNGLRLGNANPMDALGQNGPQAGVQDVMKLLDQLKQALGMEEGGGKGCQGCKGGGGSQGSGGAGGADAGMSVEDIMRKLRELARQNPQAVQQALGQNPQLTQMLGGAVGGNMSGGAGGIGPN